MELFAPAPRFLIRLSSIRDIVDDTDHAQRLALVVVVTAAAGMNPANRAVRPLDPILMLVRKACFDRLSPDLFYSLEVGRIYGAISCIQGSLLFAREIENLPHCAVKC